VPAAPPIHSQGISLLAGKCSLPSVVKSTSVRIFRTAPHEGPAKTLRIQCQSQSLPVLEPLKWNISDQHPRALCHQRLRHARRPPQLSLPEYQCRQTQNSPTYARLRRSADPACPEHTPARPAQNQDILHEKVGPPLHERKMQNSPRRGTSSVHAPIGLGVWSLVFPHRPTLPFANADRIFANRPVSRQSSLTTQSSADKKALEADDRSRPAARFSALAILSLPRGVRS
jgi:hypothetical protein